MTTWEAREAELDRLRYDVATKVFGLDVVRLGVWRDPESGEHNVCHDCTDGDTLWIELGIRPEEYDTIKHYHTELWWCVDLRPEEPEYPIWSAIPDYPNDPRSAVSIIDKMHEKGWNCEIIREDGWQVFFMKPRQDPSDYGRAEGKWFDDTICYAALDALKRDGIHER